MCPLFQKLPTSGKSATSISLYLGFFPFPHIHFTPAALQPFFSRHVPNAKEHEILWREQARSQRLPLPSLGLGFSRAIFSWPFFPLLLLAPKIGASNFRRGRRKLSFSIQEDPLSDGTSDSQILNGVLNPPSSFFSAIFHASQISSLGSYTRLSPTLPEIPPLDEKNFCRTF